MPPAPEANAHAEFRMNDGELNMSTRSIITTALELYFHENSPEDYTECALQGIVLQLAGAGASGDLDLEYGEDISEDYLFQITLTMFAYVKFYGFDEGCPMENCPPFPGNPFPDDPEITDVQFINLQLNGTDDQGQTATEVRQGVLATYDDGTMVRLGFVLDPAFDPDPDGIVDGQLTLDMGTWARQNTVEYVPVLDHFNQPGDVVWDPDDPSTHGICWNDRIALCGLLGSFIGDADYNARADVDLDGDIDDDDVTAFNTLPCSADFNCDGLVNSQDFMEFLNAHTAGDPIADANCDGVVNSQDLVAFLNSFAVGC
jgi:hypothetical protein